MSFFSYWSKQKQNYLVVMKMTTPLLMLVFILIMALLIPLGANQFNNGSIPHAYEAKVIERSNQTCPATETVRKEIHEEIIGLLNPDKYRYTCGGTDGWARIAYLNMSDSSHECPGELRETTRSVGRLCGRGLGFNYDIRAGRYICKSAIFPSNGTHYSSVCGRAIAYQHASAYTFGSTSSNIDEYYADGLSLTHGPVGAREHIWTFVTTGNEVASGCPCNPTSGSSVVVPSFMEENYFCESGNYDSGLRAFYDEPLWDGDGCFLPENNCCSFNNPPYFTRQLPASTSDDIELRDCMFSSYYGADTLIELIELYIK